MKFAFQSERFWIHKRPGCSQSELASATPLGKPSIRGIFHSTGVQGILFFGFNRAGIMMNFSTKPYNLVTLLSLYVVV
jgi:hypothetical protein